MMLIFAISLTIIILPISVITLTDIRYEKNCYNKGKCQRCAGILIYHGTDTNGMYKYKCNKCGKQILIHYKFTS